MKMLVAGCSCAIALTLPTIALANPIYYYPTPYSGQRFVPGGANSPDRYYSAPYPNSVTPVVPIAPAPSAPYVQRRSSVPTFTLPSVETYPPVYSYPRYPASPYPNYPAYPVYPSPSTSQTIYVSPSSNGVGQTYIIRSYPSYPQAIYQYGY